MFARFVIASQVGTKSDFAEKQDAKVLEFVFRRSLPLRPTLLQEYRCHMIQGTILDISLEILREKQYIFHSIW
jgi:hypothetical protein